MWKGFQFPHAHLRRRLARAQYQVMSEKFKATFGQDMEGGYPDMGAWHALPSLSVARVLRIATLHTTPHTAFSDTGNGPIAALLPFEDWARFNIAQRTHYNTVESLAIFSGLLAANAQHQPFLAGACSVTFLIGRVLYSAGYKSKGPKGRYAGAIISDIGLLGLFLGTLYLAAQKSGLVCAVKKALKGSKA